MLQLRLNKLFIVSEEEVLDKLDTMQVTADFANDSKKWKKNIYLSVQ